MVSLVKAGSTSSSYVCISCLPLAFQGALVPCCTWNAVYAVYGLYCLDIYSKGHEKNIQNISVVLTYNSQ